MTRPAMTAAATAAAADRRDRDQGSTLIFALVCILLGSLIVLPLMNYTMSVLRADRVRAGPGRGLPPRAAGRARRAWATRWGE